MSEVIRISCDMGVYDLLDMYALSPWACISGKPLMPILQLLLMATTRVYKLLIIHIASL